MKVLSVRSQIYKVAYLSNGGYICGCWKKGIGPHKNIVTPVVEFNSKRGRWAGPFPKGQLILKCLFGIFNSPKKRTRKFNFSAMVTQVNLFSFIFLGELKTPKRHFKINWHLLLKDWAAKKVTIFHSIVHLVKTSENILFFYLHFTWLCG